LVGALTGPSALRTQPVPTCDRVEGDLCATVAAHAVGETPDLVAIDVGLFGARCPANARCAAPPDGGYPYEVVATLADGSGRAWICTADATGLSCQPRFGDDQSALVPVRIVVEGVASRYVVFIDANGSSFDLVVDGTTTVQLTRGRWDMYSTDVPPPGPPNDLCPGTLDLQPGSQLELRITVTNGACSHAIGLDVSPGS